MKKMFYKKNVCIIIGLIIALLIAVVSFCIKQNRDNISEVVTSSEKNSTKQKNKNEKESSKENREDKKEKVEIDENTTVNKENIDTKEQNIINENSTEHSTENSNIQDNNIVSNSTTQTQTQTVQPGIDEDMTNQLISYCLNGSELYSGCKKSEFNGLIRSVALGSLTEADLISRVSNMTWQENARAINKYAQDVTGTISTFNVECKKSTYSGDTSAQTIASSGNISLGQCADIVAFRNSDNSITVTSFSCYLMFAN